MNCNAYIDRVRCLCAGLGILSLTSIGGALYLQFFHHQDPCLLCILQRYACVLIALCACVGVSTRRPRVMAAAAIGILAAAAGGLTTAARQLWLLKHPTFSCGFDAWQSMIDRLPLASLLPSIFKVTGFCETPYPPIFGLSLPAWSLIMFLLIFALAAFVFWRSINWAWHCPKHTNA